ncbi:hypothetical protein [Mycobacterium seoulense]|uniref:hypothetical protein n=1 Tax=Mycobacterium seoulense TaxID=386911 RepID=UPI003CF314A8
MLCASAFDFHVSSPGGTGVAPSPFLLYVLRAQHIDEREAALIDDEMSYDLRGLGSPTKRGSQPNGRSHNYEPNCKPPIRADQAICCAYD